MLVSGAVVAAGAFEPRGFLVFAIVEACAVVGDCRRLRCAPAGSAESPGAGCHFAISFVAHVLTAVLAVNGMLQITQRAWSSLGV